MHRVEKRYLRKDGGFIWADISTLLVPATGSTPPFFSAVIVDITERKLAEEALRESERRLQELNASLERRVTERTIELVRSERLLRDSEALLRESEQRFSTVFRASPAVITVSRLSDGKFVEVNDSFARWFGLDRDSILGHDSWELGLWLSLEARTKFLTDLRRNGSLREVECQFRTRRGTVRTVLVSADQVFRRRPSCAFRSRVYRNRNCLRYPRRGHRHSRSRSRVALHRLPSWP